jgi:hypothetical protein
MKFQVPWHAFKVSFVFVNAYGSVGGGDMAFGFVVRLTLLVTV